MADESTADRILNCDAFFYAEGARRYHYLEEEKFKCTVNKHVV